MSLAEGFLYGKGLRRTDRGRPDLRDLHCWCWGWRLASWIRCVELTNAPFAAICIEGSPVAVVKLLSLKEPAIYPVTPYSNIDRVVRSRLITKEGYHMSCVL